MSNPSIPDDGRHGVHAIDVLDDNGISVEVNTLRGKRVVRFFVTDIDGSTHFHDLPPEVSAALGLVIAMFGCRQVRNLGFALTLGAADLMGGAE